ncbi:MAG: hypothetical protein ACTSRS_10660 [Candidatus Helarchaeota archaeon]
MPSRKKIRRKKQDELIKKKKILKKAFQKQYGGSKRIGSGRISDTQKYILIVAAAFTIILLVSLQFMFPPKPYCYFTEGDIIYATIDQNTQTISFDKIVAWYNLRARNTILTCDITDYYNGTYKISLPSTTTYLVASTLPSDQLLYQINNVDSTLTFKSIMENGTPLYMPTWVELKAFKTTPTAIPRGIRTNVTFDIELQVNTLVDSCNISLSFYKTLNNTTIDYSQIHNGLYDSDSFTFSISKQSLPANSNLNLSFDLSINTTNPSTELNLLKTGTAHAIIQGKLLKDFPGGTLFKEAVLDFSPFGEGEAPILVATTFLDIFLTIPYFNLTLS